MTALFDWKKNRATSFLIISSLGLAAISLLLFLYFEHQHKNEVVDELQSSLSSQASDNQTLLSQTWKSNAADVRFLANTPPISGISRAVSNAGYDAEENTSLALWQERLGKIFLAFMNSHPEVAQIRYIGNNNNGKELVRVERQHGSGAMRVVPNNLLQSKGSRDYFQKPKKLSADEIYISDITLNREHGRLDYPLWPTYRIATPIYDVREDFFGVVVINYNAQLLLDTFESKLPSAMALYMIDSDGHYILHPLKAKSFEFEHQQDASSWQEDFTVVADNSESLRLSSLNNNQLLLASEKRVNLTGDEQQRYINFIVSLPETTVDKIIAQRRQASTVILLSIVLVGVVIIAIYRKIMIKDVDLSYAQSQYSALIEGSKDAILTLSTEGKIQDWNEATYQVLKLPPFDITDRQLEDLLDSDERVLLTENIAACLAGKSTATLDIDYHTSNGDLLALSVSLSPIHKDKQTIIGASTIIRDITEQILNKKQLENLNSSLEEQVRTRTEELEKAKNEAIEASNMKSGFVANVSHEIRTPLNGILGMHNLLKRENLNEKQESYLQMATQSAKSLLMLINDILDLSKIEAGKLEIESLPINLIDSFSQAANSMAVRAMDKNVEIVLDLADIKHTVVIGDDLRIRQILNNLISNAIKFTDKGEIIVSAATTEDVSGEQVILDVSVQDTGVGIEKAKLNQLFKAFSQEDSSTTRRYGGTGLGLSIVSNLCSLMNGECHVESEKNVGSTFSFRLSLKPIEKEQLRLNQILNLSNYTVRISESSHSVRHALNKLLTGWGATTILAEEIAGTEADIVISQLGENGVDDTIVMQQIEQLSLQGLHEQFIFTLSFKQRHSLETSPPPLSYHVIYRPILPMQLATALSEMTQEPITPISNTSNKTRQQSFDRSTSFEGTHILIVDDNEINQRVAAGILEHFGVEITVASNGANAIKALQETPSINLVLMDCQMPVMDGFQATEAIRRGDAGTHYKKIPIIAMTAGAMTGDREECLNAGMNDYLTKPLSAEDLESKTSLWLDARPKTQRQTIETAIPETLEQIAPPTASSSEPIFWDREASLVRLLSNEDLFLSMLEMFEQQTPELIEAIAQQLHTLDFEQLERSAHKLKGSASAIGAKLVLEAARTLEIAAHEEQEKASIAAFDTIKQEVNRMLNAIVDYKLHNSASYGTSL